MLFNHVREFPTNLRVKLGTFRDVEELKRALGNPQKYGFFHRPHARFSSVIDLFNDPNFFLEEEEGEWEFTEIQPGDVDLRAEATSLELFYEKVLSLGFELCPPEVGPQLRLQYREVYDRERYFIAMKPLKNSSGYQSIFYVGREHGEPFLMTASGAPENEFRQRAPFIFMKPK